MKVQLALALVVAAIGQSTASAGNFVEAMAAMNAALSESDTSATKCGEVPYIDTDIEKSIAWYEYWNSTPIGGVYPGMAYMALLSGDDNFDIGNWNLGNGMFLDSEAQAAMQDGDSYLEQANNETDPFEQSVLYDLAIEKYDWAANRWYYSQFDFDYAKEGFTDAKSDYLMARLCIAGG